MNRLEREQLEHAILVAARAHEGQTDRAGQPYVTHPLRVMLRCSGHPVAQVVAVLHDTLEDTALTEADLRREGFGDEVLTPLQLLTNRDKQGDYFAYVARACTHPVARRVKEADLLDNIDVTRLAHLDEHDLARVAKYHRALLMVRAAGAAEHTETP